jgi:hypothetical protein
MASPDPWAFTNCNNPGKRCGAGDPVAFLEALHRRIVDRIAWPWARDWLARHAHLELAERAGWPVLVLVLTAKPPEEMCWGYSPLLLKHYRDAAKTAGRASGPLTDLAATLELREVAQ